MVSLDESVRRLFGAIEGVMAENEPIVLFWGKLVVNDNLKMADGISDSLIDLSSEI